MRIRIDTAGYRTGLALAAALLALGVAGAASAQQPAAPLVPAGVEQPPTPPEPIAHPGEVDYEEGSRLYARRHYAEAIPYLLRAVQAEPTEARYYRGLARAAHYAEQYDLSVTYYDVYLTHFAEHAAAERSSSNREDAIRQERDRANSRRATPDQPPPQPADQQAAVDALRARLVSGPMMATDGTGAYSMYQAAIRTGYAHPDLADLRTRLIEGILAETRTMFSPSPESPVPLATIEDWRSVPNRYAAVEDMGYPVLWQPGAQARIAAAQAHVYLINGSSRLAIDHFQQAVTLDPSLVLAYWGLVLAYHQEAADGGAVPPSSQLTSILAQLEELTRTQSPQHQPLLGVARATVLFDMGRQDEAALQIIRLLAPEYQGAAAAASPGTPAPPQGPGAVPPTMMQPSADPTLPPPELGSEPVPEEDMPFGQEGAPPPEL